MANVFLTPAAIRFHKEPALQALPGLPPPPGAHRWLQEAVALVISVGCALLVSPASVPALFLGLGAVHLAQGLLEDARERRHLRAVAALADQCASRMGRRHPLVLLLGRYHRLRLRLSAEMPAVTGWRANVRRRALLQRLAHRCQSMLDEWTLWSEVAEERRARLQDRGPPPEARQVPALVHARSRLDALQPHSPVLAPVLLGPMILRSRRRRLRTCRR